MNEKPHHQTNEYHPLGLKILPLGTRRGGIRVFWIVIAIAVMLVGADFITRLLDDAPHKGFAGWFGVYGFGMAVFLVMAARLMRIVLKRPENYYDDLRERPPLIRPMRSDWSQGEIPITAETKKIAQSDTPPEFLPPPKDDEDK